MLHGSVFSISPCNPTFRKSWVLKSVCPSRRYHCPSLLIWRHPRHQSWNLRTQFSFPSKHFLPLPQFLFRVCPSCHSLRYHLIFWHVGSIYQSKLNEIYHISNLQSKVKIFSHLFLTTKRVVNLLRGVKTYNNMNAFDYAAVIIMDSEGLLWIRPELTGNCPGRCSIYRQLSVVGLKLRYGIVSTGFGRT